MSDSYETPSPSGTDAPFPDRSGKVDTAKQEAAELGNTATAGAKDVLDTAKDEAASVVGEAKSQAKDLYAQTQREVKDQANTQQQRVAMGLRAMSDELGSMAANTDDPGVASDLVQQVSARLSSAATWLGDRDPSAVLAEVKRFARRRPGTFILAAAVTGIVVGRLTRALAANASDDEGDSTRAALTPAPAPQLVPQDASSPTPVGAAGEQSLGSTHNSAPDGVGGTPVYAQAVATRPDVLGEDGDERPDAF